ncbi:unnamed protein product [Spirodela intermedia]|uniref:Tubby C-terminal domain-containing protein n=1 Tax=Spirodela intermedia TaxID=51605 RepID=A0A7I8JRP1_SPIIN|nr:unnamed protein product [Spirodela intermedia]CAA6672233.1 unnamed protein product [Spirodela intermedia]
MSHPSPSPVATATGIPSRLSRGGRSFRGEGSLSSGQHPELQADGGPEAFFSADLHAARGAGAVSWEPRSWEPIPSSSDVWDFSDNEAAPASSWSTLPSRSILYRPLPLDVGRCTCIIVKEKTQGLDGVSVYSLYTHEGHGRQDRKLAVARHKRRNGRSEFVVAQNINGVFCGSDDSFLGTIRANILGTRYHIWDQGSSSLRSKKKQSKLLGVVEFVPTITTLTGSFRNMKAWIPKQHSMQLKNTTQVHHVNGFPGDFQEKSGNSHQLHSRAPRYNNISKRYELDFRERGGRPSPRIQSSVKNFQLTLDEKGRQSILQLGRIGKMKFLMEYRYPLTGYQAFCICLASIDSKLCCSL